MTRCLDPVWSLSLEAVGENIYKNQYGSISLTIYRVIWFELEFKIKVLIVMFYFKKAFLPREKGHWAVYYTILQSFNRTFPYDLTTLGTLNFECLVY